MYPVAFHCKTWGWFHPLVLSSLWTLLSSVLPSSFLYINGLDNHVALSELSKEELNNLVTYNLILQTIALFLTYLGYFLLPKLRITKLYIHWKPPRHLMTKLIIIACISSIALLILSNVMGGLGSLLLERGIPENMRAAARLEGGHWNVLAKALTSACIVTLALKREMVKNIWFWALFVYALFLRFASTGSRGGVIVPLIMVLTIIMMQRKKIVYIRVIAMGVVAIMLVGALGSFREASWRVKSLEQISGKISVMDALEVGIDEFVEYKGKVAAIYPIIAKVPNEVDLLYGKSYLAILAAPIPRKIWPKKPQECGKLASTVFYGNPLSAIPPGSVGEAYWNFHFVGVVIVFVVWGMFLKFLADFYRTNYKERGIVALYVITILMLNPNGTSFYNWLHIFAQSFLCLIFFCGIPKIGYKIR